MPTTRTFQTIGAVTASNLWDTVDSGDALEWIFSEGVYIPQWNGYYTPTITLGHPTIGASITVTLGGFYEVTDQSQPGVPTLQATIQALINGGATITSIGGSYSSSGFDGRLTYVNPSTPTTLAELAGMQWQFTVNSIVLSPIMSLIFAVGTIVLEVADNPPLSIIGEGGVDVAGEAYLLADGFDPDPDAPPMLELFMEGGVDVSGGDDNILSVDVSGIYTLVKDKTNDTLYNRTDGGEETSLVVKIPDPFVKTGFFGG